MGVSPARLVERICFIGLGYLIATASRSWDAPPHLIFLYVGIGGLILAARWAVVTGRERRDAERPYKPG